MAIKSRLEARDEDNSNLWYFQIYGPDSTDGTYRLAATEQILGDDDTPTDWIAANLVVAQALVDAGESGSVFTIRQEAKQFLQNNPNAGLLIELGPDDLESTIETRTANQETLLLKTLSFAVRYLYAVVQEG